MNTTFGVPQQTTPFMAGLSTQTVPQLQPKAGVLFPNPSTNPVTNFAPASLSATAGLDTIASAYMPTSQVCAFRHMFYNLVSEQDIARYQKPATTNDVLWYQAVKNNPDPKHLVPVQANGFQDLKLRIEEQQTTTQNHQKALAEIEKTISNLKQKHELETLVKIEAYKQNHMELCHRLLLVMKRIEVLRAHGYQISANEEQFRRKLENVQRELNKPTHSRGRLNELISQVRMAEQKPRANFDDLDESSMENLFNFLADQKTGLLHLTEIIRQDSKDLEIMGELTN